LTKAFLWESEKYYESNRYSSYNRDRACIGKKNKEDPQSRIYQSFFSEEVGFLLVMNPQKKERRREGEKERRTLSK
jgi:hypothetical protein